MNIVDTTMDDLDTSIQGGALYIGASTVNITGSSITNSNSPKGGAIVCSGACQLNFDYSDLSNNSTTSNDGGVIFSSADGTVVTILNSTMDNNHAPTNGKGGSASVTGTGSSINLVNSTVSNSTAAGLGGGLYTTTLNMTDSTLYNNSNSNFGGGAYVSGTTTLIRGTFTNNSGTGGGGLRTATLVANGCIFNGNSGTEF